MSKKIVTTVFPHGIGKPGNTQEPVQFRLEYRSIEGYAADLRDALSKYDISDESVVDILTDGPDRGIVKIKKGKEGSGTYTVEEV